MEAELVTELPEGDWQYEPKWDGFRGVMENLKGELAVWSRNARPLLRYFPELREVGALLPPDSALDGEIVIERDGVLDFDAMQMRLHPAESRIRKLSAEIPAEFIAFDVLLWKGELVHKLPLEKRRAKLERVGKKFRLSPKTRDPEQARDWLQRLEAAGLDGVVAKASRRSLSPRLTRGRCQGEAVPDSRLRDRRLPLEREGRGPDLDAPARPL
jgi:ATP-dependent DNA ligase